ncbi:MAG TPA: hypothetical protein VIQ23_18025 [Hanamia sp.]
MQSYRLNIKVIIVAVGIFSLLVFSMVLVMFGIVDVKSVTSLLIDYAYIIAPTSLLWILVDKYLWHTRLFQAMTKLANIPPDLRGRWEGTLENESGTEIQKFVIEVKQTLTTLNVFSYSSIAHSVSILPEIAISHNEDHFVLCYLWEGKMNTSIKDIHHVEHFHGYTILNLHQYEKQKILEGFYFSNRLPSQTRGGCQLMWVSDHLKKKLD